MVCMCRVEQLNRGNMFGGIFREGQLNRGSMFEIIKWSSAKLRSFVLEQTCPTNHYLQLPGLIFKYSYQSGRLRLHADQQSLWLINCLV